MHQFTASCPPRLIPQSLELGDIAKVSTPNETFAAMISSTRKKETCNLFLFYKMILLTMCCKSECFAHANSVSLPYLNSMLGLRLSVCYEMKLNHSHIIEFGSKLWINLSFKPLGPELSAQSTLQKTWHFNDHPLCCMFLADDLRRRFVFSASHCMSTVKSSSSTHALTNKCHFYYNFNYAVPFSRFIWM